MKLAAIFCALMLAGCATQAPVIKTEIVTVNKPVPFIPPPPKVPTIDYKVDHLTQTDRTLPGKVGQAYVYDMTFLRQRILIDDMILDQYRKGSADFKTVEQRINELYKDVEAKSPTVDPK